MRTAPQLARRRPRGSIGRDALRACATALARYRLRTALSVVGIALGVGAVVAMVSVGQGARAEALRQAAALGLENVVVRYRSPSFDEQARRPSPGLTIGDARRIAALGRVAVAVSPLRAWPAIAAGPHAREDITALAVGSAYFSILGLDVARGRPLVPLDDASIARVCVIGSALGAALFGAEAPVGRALAIDGVPYVVVGVLADRRTDVRPVGAISPRALERAALVPLNAAVAHDARTDRWLTVDEIWVRAAGGVDPVALGDAVDRSLRTARLGGADYDVVVPVEIAGQQVRLRRTFDVVVGAIAIVTLLVGGIGVMNVMLTSVFERTPEIGLRRAVGATRRAIAGQFALEAVAISGAGGVAGLAIGIGAAAAIGVLGGWPTLVSWPAVAAAVGLAAGVGLLSGLYPALRAAAVDPVEAVRYE